MFTGGHFRWRTCKRFKNGQGVLTVYNMVQRLLKATSCTCLCLCVVFLCVCVLCVRYMVHTASYCPSAYLPLQHKILLQMNLICWLSSHMPLLPAPECLPRFLDMVQNPKPCRLILSAKYSALILFNRAFVSLWNKYLFIHLVECCQCVSRLSAGRMPVNPSSFRMNTGHLGCFSQGPFFELLYILM